MIHIEVIAIWTIHNVIIKVRLIFESWSTNITIYCLLVPMPHPYVSLQWTFVVKRTTHRTPDFICKYGINHQHSIWNRLQHTSILFGLLLLLRLRSQKIIPNHSTWSWYLLIWYFKLSIFLKTEPQIWQPTVSTFSCWLRMCLFKEFLWIKAWHTGHGALSTKKTMF